MGRMRIKDDGGHLESYYANRTDLFFESTTNEKFLQQEVAQMKLDCETLYYNAAVEVVEEPAQDLSA